MLQPKVLVVRAEERLLVAFVVCQDQALVQHRMVAGQRAFVMRWSRWASPLVHSICEEVAPQQGRHANAMLAWAGMLFKMTTWTRALAAIIAQGSDMAGCGIGSYSVGPCEARWSAYNVSSDGF